MLMTEKQFFTEELDFSISALAKTKALFEAGKLEEAYSSFASFIKGALDSEKYFILAQREVAGGGSTRVKGFNVI